MNNLTDGDAYRTESLEEHKEMRTLFRNNGIPVQSLTDRELMEYPDIGWEDGDEIMGWGRGYANNYFTKEEFLVRSGIKIEVPSWGGTTLKFNFINTDNGF